MTDAERIRAAADDRVTKAKWALDSTRMAKSGYAPRKAELARWVVEMGAELARVTEEKQVISNINFNLTEMLARVTAERDAATANCIDVEKNYLAQFERRKSAEARAVRLEAALREADKRIDVILGYGPEAVAAYHDRYRGVPTTLKGVREEAKEMRSGIREALGSGQEKP